MIPNEPVVVSQGVGVNGMAMILGWRTYGLPTPAALLFANVGSEKFETYAYIPVMNDWLDSVGWPRLTVVKNKSPIAGDASLHDECLRKSVLPSLSYGGHSCSIKWKVEPQLKWVRDTFGWSQPRRKRGAAERPDGTFRHGPTITKLVGYDAGPKDARRVKNATEKWPPGHNNRYPLIEWGWDRRKCIDVIIAARLPGWNPAYLADDLVTFTRFEWIESGGVPCKSACFMCPASQPAEINMLAKHHPELIDIAIEMEDRAIAKGLRTVKGLGRTRNWKAHLAAAALPEQPIAQLALAL